MSNIFSITFNLDRLLCCSWGCIYRHSKYLCNLQEDLEYLKSACEKLTEARDDVQRQVDMAEREQLQVLEQVRGWLSRVQTLETQVNQLIRNATGELQQKCLGEYCPRHCRRPYKLGKRVAKMLKDLGELTTEKPLSVAAERVPPPGVSERPSEATVGMDARLDLAWSRLHEEGVGIVGLYGLGGVGKTTLLNRINNAFNERATDFDLVIWSTVSRNVNLEKIQDDIWKKIGICDEKWKGKDRDEKAASIWKVLSKNRFVLLLDDVWEWLNLVEVGVPLRNKKNKIVLTTRSEEVCGEMEADLKIKVEGLNWTESWDLFRLKLGEDILNSHTDIPELAEVVARECCGLPLALNTMGRAMACKRTPQEWRHAVKVLRNSASKFPGMGDKVFPLLKYTFDSLPTEDARSCFLYCSLYPEDYKIPKGNLIIRWISEGLLDANDDDMKAAKNHGHNMIGTLIHACLLEETNDSFYVRMHDVIRDMALWIACESGGAQDRFLVKARCGLTEAPELGKWMEPKRISLMSNQINQLIESPNCPNLVTLFLDSNPLKMITDDFFQFMPNLRLLTLSRTAITELPKGISNLVSLQYLDLLNTMIKELSIELKSLHELKYLVLYDMPQFFSIPKQLISCLLELRIIVVLTSTISNGAILKDDQLSDGFEVLVKELESLKYLDEVLFPITTASTLERLLGSDKLRSCIDTLDLLNFNATSSLNLASLNNAKHLRTLYISYCDLLEDLEIDWAWNGKENIQSSYLNSNVCLQSLENVVILNCQKLKDITWLAFAPNLKFLFVRRCDQLQEVVSRHKCADFVENGESLSPFTTLRGLFLEDLPLLKSIFWKALPFTNLITLRIYKCPLLKKLPLNTDSAKGHRLAIYGNKGWWNEVEWEDKATHTAFLPCFLHVEGK